MALLGPRLLDNIPTDVKPGDWDSVVPIISFQSFPLTSIFYLSSEKPVEDIVFNWYDKVLPLLTFKLGANAGSGDTSLVLDGTYQDVTGTTMDYTFVTKGTILRNVVTGEEVAVTATPSSNTISVQRGVGSVPASAMTAGQVLSFQGVIASEGKLALSKVNIDPAKRVNTVEKFSDIATEQSLEHSLIVKRIEGFDLEDQRIEALYRYSQGLEEAFLTGTPYISGGSPSTFTFDSGTAYKTGGIKYLLDTYAPNRIIVSSDGSVSESYLNQVLANVFNFDRGNRERLAICGNGFIQVINELAKKNLVRYSDEVTEYFGLKVFDYISPFGTIHLMPHPLFSDPNSYWTHSNTAYDRTYSALLLDPNTIVRREMLPLIEKDNVQGNDELKKKSAFVSICGLEINPVVYNALLLNFKQAV